MIDDASPDQAKQLFLRFYGREEEDIEGWERVDPQELDKMGARVESIVEQRMREGKRVSMAALQGLFIRNNAARAAEAIQELYPS